MHALGGIVQRALAVLVGDEARARGEKQARRLLTPEGNRVVQRREAEPVARIHVRAGHDQQRRPRRVRAPRRGVQGRLVVVFVALAELRAAR